MRIVAMTAANRYRFRGESFPPGPASPHEMTLDLLVTGSVSFDRISIKHRIIYYPFQPRKYQGWLYSCQKLVKKDRRLPGW